VSFVLRIEIARPHSLCSWDCKSQTRLPAPLEVLSLRWDFRPIDSRPFFLASRWIILSCILLTSVVTGPLLRRTGLPPQSR